ncbi:MAG TPA: hypothetical protein DEP19_05930 [Anaerolineae bacterium]|nr:hypothetical protein [Anaerolineae bacterium]HCK66844.1 hypothetical protein [Anaerolineae bacterium]
MDLPIMDNATYGGISVARLVAFRMLDKEEIQEIGHRDKVFLDRLVRVISRVSFTDYLRFKMPLSLVTTDIDDALEGFHRDDLELYLLCTCLDTLAGKDNYIDFSGWTRTSKEIYSGVKERENFLDELYNSSHTFNRDVYSTLIEGLIGVYSKYFGVIKNIHNLVRSLPEYVQIEIVNSYTILKVNSDPNSWNIKTTEQKLKVILDYLLDCRRHQYTHSAKTVSTFGEIRAMRKALVDGVIDMSDSKTKIIKWKRSEFSITCHYGEEAFLLREIIFACIASSLGILDAEWVLRYRKAERQRKILWALIYEIDYNLKVMQLHLDALSEKFVILESEHPPHFRVNVATLILRNKDEINFKAYVPLLDKYLELANKFNQILDETKKINKDQLADSEFRSLAPILRGYCNNLMHDYPEWVYNKDYVYDFSI